jgi:hypothetical protein
VNKPINLYYFYLCIHIFLFIFYFFYFFYFLLFMFLGAGPSSAHVGAGLDPASPAWPLAQASGPAGQKKKKHA